MIQTLITIGALFVIVATMLQLFVYDVRVLGVYLGFGAVFLGSDSIGPKLSGSSAQFPSSTLVFIFACIGGYMVISALLMDAGTHYPREDEKFTVSLLDLAVHPIFRWLPEPIGSEPTHVPQTKRLISYRLAPLLPTYDNWRKDVRIGDGEMSCRDCGSTENAMIVNTPFDPDEQIDMSKPTEIRCPDCLDAE